MFEIRIASLNGWTALPCTCAAGRAVFVTEQAANRAIAAHVERCGRVPDGVHLRVCAVELIDA